MILCLLLFLVLFQSQKLNQELKKTNQDLIKSNKNLIKLDELTQELETIKNNNKELKIENSSLKSTPIIIDEKSGEFKFKSGSAELNQDLKKHIKNKVVPNIKNNLKDKDIDFIQIIGHTDGQVNSSNSNLDQTLEKVARGDKPFSELKSGSNADLGLMRALAVVQELQNNDELKNLEFRAYSAAQLYLPGEDRDILAPVNRQPDETRRRIEIRFIPPGQLQQK